jgi:proteasome accessory factor C
VVDRALAKLETAAAQGSAEGGTAAQIDPGADADTDLALLARRLQGAADRGRHVRLSYYVPSRDEQSDRVVDPRGVVTADGHLYLDAWCHSAEAPRLFRLDRIDRAEVLDEAVEKPQEEPRNLADGIFSQSSEVTPVTLLVEPEARWMTEYYPVEEIREVGQDRIEVVLLVADERWLTRLMLRLAPHATVLSPASYAETFRTAAQRALSLYS